MIVTLAFVLLALAALGGAAGLLWARRVDHGVWAFGVICAALGGLYGLLNNPLAVAMQVMSLFVMGGLLAMGWAAARSAVLPRALWWTLPVGLGLAALAGWAVLSGQIGGAPAISMPIWVVREDWLAALGQELLNEYVILIELLGLFLLTCLVGIAYVRRSRPAG